MIRFLRRAYPSANTVLVAGPRPVLIDPGSADEAPELFAWLAAQDTDPATLTLAVNTHWHVDHSGANPAIRALGVPLAAPAAEAAALGAGTDDPCRARFLHQPHPEYRVDRPLHPGDALDGGWTVIPLPGHSAGQIGLHHAGRAVLVAGDALHDGDIGWLDVDEDAAALDHQAETLDRIEALGAATILSGHGPAITDAPAALERARRRLERFRHDPRARAWHAAKRIFTHALMLEGGVDAARAHGILLQAPWFAAMARRDFDCAPDAFVAPLLAEMERSGAARWRDGLLQPTTEYTPPLAPAARLR